MRFSHTLTTDLVETLMICSYLLWQMLNWLLKRGQCTLLEGINPAEPPQICTPPSSSVHFTSWGEGGDICPLSCPPPLQHREDGWKTPSCVWEWQPCRKPSRSANVGVHTPRCHPSAPVTPGLCYRRASSTSAFRVFAARFYRIEL